MQETLLRTREEEAGLALGGDGLADVGWGSSVLAQAVGPAVGRASDGWHP